MLFCLNSLIVTNCLSNYCAAAFWYGSDRLCFVSLVQSVLGAYKPCPAEARRQLAPFCSLLKVYSFWTCRVSKLHKMRHCTPLGPQQHTCHVCRLIRRTVLDIIKMRTDRHLDIPAFITEKNMFSPLPLKLCLFSVDYYRGFEAQKMVFGPALKAQTKQKDQNDVSLWRHHIAR